MRCLLCLCFAATGFACLNDTAYKSEEQRFASEYQRRDQDRAPAADLDLVEPADLASRFWLVAGLIVVAAGGTAALVAIRRLR